MKNFNIIGAGNVGITLRLLLCRAGLSPAGIYSRSVQSAQKACDIMDGGTVVSNLADLPLADLTLITTSDTAIADVVAQLAAQTELKPNSIALHCSGALPSSILAPVQDKGVLIASVHPVKSFTNPEIDADLFEGTYCGMEGDAEALEVLEPLFKKMGANIFRIEQSQKTLYHAGTVMACNYLAPLMQAAMQCHEDAGIDRATSWKILEPLVRDTITNIGKLGPAKALTGPIARGDVDVVAAQMEALGKSDTVIANLYAALGNAALPLAREKAVAEEASLNALQNILTGHLG